MNNPLDKHLKDFLLNTVPNGEFEILSNISDK